MRSQRTKISASGQAVGGDMLFGRRVGFSGTPSDLLPVELGQYDPGLRCNLVYFLRIHIPATFNQSAISQRDSPSSS